MRINLTERAIANLMIAAAITIFVINVVVIIDYLIIKRPILAFQNDFDSRQAKFTDSLKAIDSDNEVVCITFRKSSPYLFITVNVTDSNFNNQASKDLFAAAKRDLLLDARCKEAVVLLRNGLKFAKHTFDLIKGTDSFGEVKDGLVAKWCIEDSCRITN